jgi:ribonucleoside-triphosphate reductase
MRERIAGGYLPLYTHNWIDLNRQYSTVGFVGGYEYVANKGHAIETEKGVKILQDTLMKIEHKVVEWQTNEKEEKNIYNIEQIPAESMAVRLADMDYILGFNRENATMENLGKIANKKFNLYSNQYIPLVSNASIYDRFKVQGQFDSLTSGGAILHINVDDEKPISKDQFKKLMNAARKLKTVYYAINYAYSECANGHFVIGKHETCEVCGAKIIQQFTRVVGFITPVKSWNSTRRTIEYPNRIFYHNGALDIDKETKMSTVAALPELPPPSLNKLVAVASVCC